MDCRQEIVTFMMSFVRDHGDVTMARRGVDLPRRNMMNAFDKGQFTGPSHLVVTEGKGATHESNEERFPGARGSTIVATTDWHPGGVERAQRRQPLKEMGPAR